MTPFDANRTVIGDCRETLRSLPAETFNCCVTSPPYLGLRDYGVVGQLGLEATPDEYVAKMVEVFREVRRVLREDGTLWLNLGDSYCSSAGSHDGRDDNQTGVDAKRVWRDGSGRADGIVDARGQRNRNGNTVPGLKPKDLVGIPWLVAFALRADGWYLRSEIIWHKPNAMPESVQGSHFVRHLVTIEEYENLSGLRYAGERLGDAWAADMPPLSEREAGSRKAPLSAESLGLGHDSGLRVPRGGQGEAQESITLRSSESAAAEVRGYGEGESDPPQDDGEVQGNAEGQADKRAASRAHEGRPGKTRAAPRRQQPVSQDGEREGSVAATECEASRRDPFDGEPADGGRLAGHREASQGALLLLQEEAEADAGPRDPVEQGRQARQVERGPGVRSVQFDQAGPPDPSLLVGCPGCSECVKHHGWIFRYSAGRPTKAHEQIFLLAKSARYYYDADAIKDRAIYRVSERTKGNGESAVDTKLRGTGSRCGSLTEYRNARTVWTVATQPYSGSHFATFPPDLIKPCILAGCPAGGVVLDPFIGSGTVGEVSEALGRRWFGCELNPEYGKLIAKRTAQTGLIFADGANRAE